MVSTLVVVPADAASPDPATLAPARRRPGPVARLSREAIADAVLDVGFDELTVALVAARLDVAAGALYRYIDDRDDLVVAAFDRLFATLPFPTDERWDDFLRSEAWLRWEALTAHPGLIRELRASRRRTVEGRRRYVRCVAALNAFGFGAADALLAVDTVIDLVHDATQSFHALRRIDVEAAGWAAFEWTGSADDRAALDAVAADVVARPEAFFTRKLDVAIAGLGVVTDAITGDH